MPAVVWRSRGLLLPAPVPPAWAVSHAALPTPEGPGGALLFAARDGRGRSAIGRAHTDLEAGSAEVEDSPVLLPGRLGAFDDSGVTPSCVVEHEGRRLLYYTGWSLGHSVPFYLFAGCAVAEAGGPYVRVSEAPVLERSAVDPLLTASPWVLVEDGRWRMWYVSAARWEEAEGEPRHWYHVRYAESDDGIAWRRDGTVCLDFAGPEEHAFSRPCVVREDGRWRMWFAVRGGAYRLGSAVSEDGIRWERDDDAARLEGLGAWDSEMQAYPVVVESAGGPRLLYNGDGYGRTGIGYAEPIASR